MHKHYDSFGNLVHIYNFTPHPIDLLVPGVGRLSLPPDGEPVRVSMHTSCFPCRLPSPVPVLQEHFADMHLPTDLQLPAICIVSRLALSALHQQGDWERWYRAGVMYASPAAYQRDEDGNIVAATALTVS